jgi:hypothetical protein
VEAGEGSAPAAVWREPVELSPLFWFNAAQEMKTGRDIEFAGSQIISVAVVSASATTYAKLKPWIDAF